MNNAEKQPPLIESSPAPPTKNCERCGKRCLVTANRNPNAQVFVKGDLKTGRFCAECLVVDFLRNFDSGPVSAMGKWYFDPTEPVPEGVKKDTKRFDPEYLRLPHIQEQFRGIALAAQEEYGAELTPEDIDWDEVIANWNLPFAQKPGRKKRRAKE